MKVHTLLLVFTLLIPQISQAGGGMSCAAILEKAKPVNKKAVKSACVMVEHTIGMGRGSTESIYDCKGTKYKLITDEDYACTATLLKK